MLKLCALASLAIPLTSLVAALLPSLGLWAHTSAATLGVDFAALADAALLLYGARLTARRVLHGPVDSVWSAVPAGAGLADDLLGRADLGGEAWWRAVRDVGTAAVPRAAGRQFRAELPVARPDGGAFRLPARLSGRVFAHARIPPTLTSMARLGHSDVWLWQTRLPADWRGSYF